MRISKKFLKNDAFKSWLDLLPPDAIEIVGFVLRHGARKYAPNNWQNCRDPNRYVGAMLRHSFKHLKGEISDPESGLLHLAHAVCSGLIALDLFFNLSDSTLGGNMERKHFSYFAIVSRKSAKAKRGVVVKRFRSYESCWNYLTTNELEPSLNIVKTVKPSDKIGSVVTL